MKKSHCRSVDLGEYTAVNRQTIELLTVQT
jgi:hypothetical protein